MEIAPVPRRPPLSTGGRLLVALAVLLPVTVFTLLPILLGMERYVVTGEAMGGTLSRGSLVFERQKPVSELEVGDVITFTPPDAPAGTRVTRRLVSIEEGRARTQGDEHTAPDPWTLSLDQPTQSTVVVAVPWVGYPFVGVVGRGAWLVITLVALGCVLALVARPERRRRRRGPEVGRVLT